MGGVRREKIKIARSERKDVKWVTKGKGARISDKLEERYSAEATNLASNWGLDRLTSQQIRRVSKLMDEGKTHAQATAEVVSVGNAALDRVFSKFNL